MKVPMIFGMLSFHVCSETTRLLLQHTDGVRYVFTIRMLVNYFIEVDILSL